jgi:hypothetical protein
MISALSCHIAQRIVVIPYDVSGQPVGSIKGQEIQEKTRKNFLNLEGRTGSLFRNVGKE